MSAPDAAPEPTLHCLFRVHGTVPPGGGGGGGTPDDRNATRPDWATRVACLRNFLREFGTRNVGIMLDRVDTELLAAVGRCVDEAVAADGGAGAAGPPRMLRTNVGNAGSFAMAVNVLTSPGVFDVKPGDYVYVVDDDVVHAPGARAKLLLGLQVAEYVSLWDAPDKYRAGGEQCRILLTPDPASSARVLHWKTTASTGTTFAARMDALARDRPRVAERLGDPAGDPDMAGLWSDILAGATASGTRIVTPLPGAASHTRPALATPGLPLAEWAA
jgi:hypothetical protein